jgi:hypothetical protein
VTLLIVGLSLLPLLWMMFFEQRRGGLRG